MIHTVVPFTELIVQICGSLAVLFVRLVAMLLINGLGYVQRTLSSFDSRRRRGYATSSLELGSRSSHSRSGSSGRTSSSNIHQNHEDHVSRPARAPTNPKYWNQLSQETQEDQQQPTFAAHLARMALRAQIELDKRLSQLPSSEYEDSAECTDDPQEVASDSEAVDDTDSLELDLDDESTPRARLASITSTDPTTPLSQHPITVSLRRTAHAPHSPPHPGLSRSWNQATPSAWTLSDPLVSTTVTAPSRGERRASAPASILQSSATRSATPSEAGSSLGFETSTCTGSSTGRKKIKLIEPDWQPFVQVHARARARVQLAQLLNSTPTTKSGRRNYPAMQAHARHVDTHAAVHTMAHASATATIQPQGRERQRSVSSSSPSISTDARSTVPSAPPSSSSSSSTCPAGSPDEVWFEHLFPARAPRRTEWDWRQAPDTIPAFLHPTVTGILPASPAVQRTKRAAAQEIAKQASVASAILAARSPRSISVGESRSQMSSVGSVGSVRVPRSGGSRASVRSPSSGQRLAAPVPTV